MMPKASRPNRPLLSRHYMGRHFCINFEWGIWQETPPIRKARFMAGHCCLVNSHEHIPYMLSELFFHFDFLYHRWFKNTNEQSYFAWVGFMPEAQKVPVSTILLTHLRPLFLLLSNLEFYLKESSLSCHA